VIVSHKYRFIFIKTHKVAGTSIEFALTRFAGEDSIVTPFSVRIDERERERSGFGIARNNKTGAGEYRAHTAAEEVRNLLGRETFGRYFKFSVERNPYDKVVSLYTWLNRDPSTSACRAHRPDGHKAQIRISDIAGLPDLLRARVTRCGRARLRP